MLFNILVAVLFVGIGTLLAGRFRWHRLTRVRRATLESATVESAAAPFDPAELDGLPDPVRRYLSRVLRAGQPPVRSVRMEHAGMFRLNRSERGWRAFRSEQTVTVFPPGMLWNARIRMNAAITARVHDAYIRRGGLLHATLLGLVTIARKTDAGALAEGELMRWLAEAVWYPTALLPASGVRWEAIDAATARAHLEDGAIRVSLDFTFDEDGLVSEVRAAKRYRGEKGGVAQMRPWLGRFASWGDWGGMTIPVEGEVAWEMDGEVVPYWRGRLQAIEHGA